MFPGRTETLVPVTTPRPSGAPAAWDPGAELGPRLRRVREERGLSARELARRVHCSPSLISQIERGLSAPSAGILYSLATELGASLDFLFGVTPGEPPAQPAAPAAGAGQRAPLDGHGIVQRRSSRRVIELASGVRWDRLTPAADDRVDFLEVRYEPGGHSTDSRQALRHDGYEYGLITSGTLRATVGFESYELAPGDSLAFDSSTPHEYWNATAGEVLAVWVVVHSEPGRA